MDIHPMEQALPVEGKSKWEITHCLDIDVPFSTPPITRCNDDSLQTKVDPIMEQAIDSWTIVPDAPASSLIPEQALPAASSNVPSAPPAEQGMLSIRRTEAWQQEQGPP